MRAWTLPLLLCVSAACGGDAAPPAAASRLFVADERAGTVSVFDEGTWSAVTAIDLTEQRDGVAVRYRPHNVQVSPDGRTVWATAASAAFYTAGFAGEDDEQVIVLDAARLTVLARVRLTGLLAHVVFDEAGRRAYVTATNADEVVELDAATREVTRRFRVGLRRGPHGARVCGATLFVACSVGRSVAMIDLATGAVTEVRLDGAPIQVACARDGRTAYTALQDQRVVVRVDVATGEVSRLALPDAARGPAQVYLSPDGARLWVADQGLLTTTSRLGNRVYEVEVGPWRLGRSAEVGRGAHGVVTSRDGARVYVTGTIENNVAVLDAATLQPVASVPVGLGPNGISLRDARGGMP